MSTHPLTVGPSREAQATTLCTYIQTQLPENKAFTVEIKPFRRKRSTDQNRYLWGVVYSTIIDSCDEPKPSADALHEYWLGECFGWNVTDTLGWVQRTPMRRSSSLNTEEFGQFWAFIQRRCAETRGIVIPDPDPQWKFHNEVDS